VPTFPIRPVSLGFRVDVHATAHGLSRAIAAAFDMRASLGDSDRCDPCQLVRGIAAIGARVAERPHRSCTSGTLPPTTAVG
jgi:hypothetical protein